ncbi:BMP family ABC transporter substrate-binding protein [Entomospira nematocerorum]|uniref:BMP family ABC transporter substrate-binding protein n=1 Tax=Entomospira nematocerorum TaxID=2719987 RepID=A0A968GBZ3_9SPIO|nr:BMP family ABC transporter substrate-binding protein [Entomospira nematocera]NIZ46628.1 BMP family ABC transporter substrate-binding protein [Entomospira nematocera]WDI33574.1 BMP family ABC transporter substrate-binding protein [Entomospira nematocera]
MIRHVHVKKIMMIMIGGLLLIGCKKESGDVHSSTASHKNPSVIHITEAGGVDDNSFNASTWRGINQFYEGKSASQGKDFSYITTPTLAQMEENLLLATDKEPTLIIAAGFNFIHPLEKVARQHPEQYYMLIDGPEFHQLTNVKSAYFADEQSAFLVGALAALKSQEDGIENPVFGFIGGMPGGVITRFEMGYLQGIKHILGENARIVSYYADDWANPAKAKTVTQKWLNQYPELYAIFSAAGPTGNGTIAQVKEAYNKRTVWAIGVDSDQYQEGLVSDGQSVVLTSAMKNADNAVYQTLVELESGHFAMGQYRYDLSNGGVGFSRTNAGAISEDILEQMHLIEESIIAGDIPVYATLAKVESAGLLGNYTTAAKDD